MNMRMKAVQKDKRNELIWRHFNRESADFDTLIKKRVPFYECFIRTLVNVLPFSRSRAIKVVDLGCGTGQVADQVKRRFPKAQITCVDFSPKMLAMAKARLRRYRDISYYQSDLWRFKFEKYNAILSSLCLHHIGSGKEKATFFRKVNQSLLPGGVFYIYDVVLASSDKLQKVYLEEWKKFMKTNLSEKEILDTLQKYREEDRPFALQKELSWLEIAGFKSVEVICKFYNGAVYGGSKRK